MMQRAKTILYLEQKLSSSIWRDYCEYIHKTCSPEVSNLSEDVDLGKRDKKRTKEKLLRDVEEIHSVINERFGPKVGTATSDMDKLLTGVDKLNKVLASRLQRNDTNLTQPGSMNLNIILNHENTVGNSMIDGLAVKREALLEQGKSSNGKLKSSGPKQNETKRNFEQSNGSRSPSSSNSSQHSNDGIDGRLNNGKIQKQLDIILGLMKEAIKSGKLNFTINGKAFVTERNAQGELVEGLIGADNVSNPAQRISDSGDATQCKYGISNPACSPVLFDFEENPDETRHSPLDLYTSDEVNVSTPVQSPNVLDGEHRALIDSERLTARYEGNSFLSTSSAEFVTTCDENSSNSSQTSVVSNNNEKLSSPNSSASQTRAKPKKSHRRIQPPKILLPHETGRAFGGSSESDVSTQEGKTRVRKYVPHEPCQSVVDDDFSSSSFGTDITDQSYDDDSQASGVGHYASTDIAVNYSTSPERDGLVCRPDVPRVPHVRWADTASEAGSTTFLNIHEISASPSECLSGDVRPESDTASADEGQIGIEKNSAHQTDV